MRRNGWRDLDTTSKQRSRSFTLVPIDFSYTTSYKLSIVTFALGRTGEPQYIPYRRQTDRPTKCTKARTLVRSAKLLRHMSCNAIGPRDNGKIHRDSVVVLEEHFKSIEVFEIWILVLCPRGFSRFLITILPRDAGVTTWHRRLAGCSLSSAMSRIVSSTLAILAPSHGTFYCYDIPRYIVTLAILVSSRKYWR